MRSSSGIDIQKIVKLLKSNFDPKDLLSNIICSKKTILKYQTKSQTLTDVEKNVYLRGTFVHRVHPWVTLGSIGPSHMSISRQRTPFLSNLPYISAFDSEFN